MAAEKENTNNRVYFPLVMEVDDAEIKKIFEDLRAAQNIIWDCYNRLENLNVIRIARADSEASVEKHFI